VTFFTRVPKKEAISLLGRRFEEDILKRFHHVLAPYFSFGDQFYGQTDSVAVGSTVSPVLASYFTEHLEEVVHKRAIHNPPLLIPLRG
jgi:hypothetical protein